MYAKGYHLSALWLILVNDLQHKNPANAPGFCKVCIIISLQFYNKYLGFQYTQKCVKYSKEYPSQLVIIIFNCKTNKNEVPLKNGLFEFL